MIDSSYDSLESNVAQKNATNIERFDIIFAVTMIAAGVFLGFGTLVIGVSIALLGVGHVIFFRISDRHRLERHFRERKGWSYCNFIAGVMLTLLLPDLLGIFFLIIGIGNLAFFFYAKKKLNEPVILHEEHQPILDEIKPEPIAEQIEFFMPRAYRVATIIACYCILGTGIAVFLILGFYNFLFLGLGEIALFYIYKLTWNHLQKTLARKRREGESVAHFSYARFVVMTWAYAMLMEFCVDFGAYGVINPVIVLIIMASLTPHYLILGIVFRLWYRWFTFTPREAFFAMGTFGFLLESFILKLYSGTFQWVELVLAPLYFLFHVLNYGGFVVMPTLYQNQDEKRPPVKTWKKFAAGIGGTLGIMLPIIIGNYMLLYSFHLW